MPANRVGHGVYSVAEPKTIQEVITLVVFMVFSVFYLREGITWKCDWLRADLRRSGADFRGVAAAVRWREE